MLLSKTPISIFPTKNRQILIEGLTELGRDRKAPEPDALETEPKQGDRNAANPGRLCRPVGALGYLNPHYGTYRGLAFNIR